MSYVDTVVNNSLPALAQPYFLWPEWVQNLFGLHLGWTPVQTLRTLWHGYLALLPILIVLALFWRWRGNKKRARYHWLAFYFVLFTAPFFDLPFIHYEVRKGCSQLTGVLLYQRISAQGYYRPDKSAGDIAGMPAYPQWRKSDKKYFQGAYHLGDGAEFFRYMERPESTELIEKSFEKGKKSGRPQIVHYEWRDGQVMETLLEQPQARYAYELIDERRISYALGFSELRVTDMQTDKVMARRMNVRYKAGFLEANTLGAFGGYLKECPAPLLDLYPESAQRKNTKIIYPLVSSPLVKSPFLQMIFLNYPPESYAQLVFEEE